MRPARPIVIASRPAIIAASAQGAPISKAEGDTMIDTDETFYCIIYSSYTDIELTMLDARNAVHFTYEVV